jgi:hypothetical protein
MQKKRPSDFQRWIDARQKFHLSHAHLQMAQELGLNPQKFAPLANHRQPWKAPLPDFIEELYYKRYGRARPLEVLTLEQRWAQHQQKQEPPKTPEAKASR